MRAHSFGIAVLLFTRSTLAQVAPAPAVQPPKAPTLAVAPEAPFSFFPASGEHGTLVTIVGPGVADATSVKLGDWEAPIESRGKSSVTLVVPTMPHGAAKWSLVTPRGNVSPSGTFTVSQTPIGSEKPPCTFASASPGARMDVAAVIPEGAKPGEKIQILGANLTKANSVTVGGVMLDLVSSTNERIVAQIPNLAQPTTGFVQVRGPNEIVVSCATLDVLAATPSAIVKLTREQPSRTITFSPWGGRLEFDVAATVESISIEGSHEKYAGQNFGVDLLLFAPDGKASKWTLSPYTWTVPISIVNSTAWSRAHWVAKVVPVFEKNKMKGTFTITAKFPPLATPAAAGPKPPTGNVTSKP